MYSVIFFTFILFFMSILGLFMSKQNIMVMLMSIELMLLSLNFNFVLFSLFFDDALSQLFFFILLALAGAEASIGLSMLMMFYSVRGLISVYFMNFLKG